MSGVVKSFKKVFKKIIAPVLAVGAIVFTAGAALGLPAFAGGFGGAVAKGLGAIGIKSGGVLSKVLTGAVTKGGIGAAIGGTTSALTGGSFSDGAAKGALAGAVVGGLTGLAGSAVDPLTTASKTVNPASIASTQPATAASGSGLLTSSGAQTVANGIQPAATAAATPAATGLGGGLFPNGFANSGLGKFVTSQAGGQVISGLGQGLMGGIAAKDEADSIAAERSRRIAAYEGSGDALDWGQDLFAEEDDRAARKAAQEDSAEELPAWKRYASKDRRGSKRYRYDANSDSVVFG